MRPSAASESQNSSPSKSNCDLWFDFHAGYGIPGFLGTLAVHIARRKNDCERKGHHPAVGRALDPDLDLVHQLKVWLRNHGLRVSPLCQKSANPAFPCPNWPPLFSRLENGAACRSNPTLVPLSPQMIGDAVRRVVAACGADIQRFPVSWPERAGSPLPLQRVYLRTYSTSRAATALP